MAVPDLSSIDVSKLVVDETAKESKVVAIWKDGVLVDEITDGEEAGIILDKTPFYAEGGGQVGDEGMFISEFGRIKAVNAKRLPDGTVYHEAYVEEGQLKVGEMVKIEVDQVKKLASARNHTATHLLQAALKQVVGDQVNQAGSSVTPERLRFDFTNFEPVTAQQLADVEELVNSVILKGQDVEISHMSIEEAKEAGAMALFSEKYGDVVRVVKVPGFSMELCAGSHVKNVGQVGMFKIVSESGVASGVRRIEAITGKAALDYVNGKMAVLSEAASLLKTKEEELPAQIEKVQAESKEMSKQLAEVAEMREKADAQNLLTGLKTIKDVNVVCGKSNASSMDELRDVADMTSSKIESPSVVVLACANEGKVNLVVKADKAAVAKGIHAGKIIKEAAQTVGGGGGGRPDMAQAGGKNAEALPKAFDKAVEVIESQLG